MMKQADDVVRRGARSDLEELKKDLTAMIAIALTVSGGIVSWLLLPSASTQPWRFVVFLSLFLEGSLSYHLRVRKPLVSRTVLLLGPTLSLSLALRAIQNPAIPFFAALIVIGNSMINPYLGLAGAALTTVPLYLLCPPSELVSPAVALLWLAAMAQWLSSRGLYTVLGWAWKSQQRANHLLETLRDRQGQLNRTLAALTEASRRLERISHQLALAQRRAAEARRLKEQFAANISHELRTPLNFILGFSEMMYLSPEVYGEMEWPSTLRSDVHQIYRSSCQLLDLINDVLDLSRINAVSMPIHKRACDLEQIICEAVDMVSDLCRDRDVALRVELAGDLPQFDLDATRIRQVLLNLLNNATRFTERGNVVVSVERNEQEVVVSVSDTGSGISPDELSKVFEEFYQVDMSLRKRQGGAGLGLAISKAFVELHGGRIWAESQVGEGSTFRFCLPLPEMGGAPGRLSASSTGRPPRSPSQVPLLLVEEDPAVATLLGRYLHGYHVLRIGELDAGKVRDLIEEWHPQALIVNLRPGANHWKAICEAGLRIAPPRVPVLVCSLPSQKWQEEATNVRGWLTKPVRREQILETLHRFEGARDVLVVDDSPGFLQLVARFLEGSDGKYCVRFAPEGKQALACIREKLPDLILLDLIMPGMDGFQLLEKLQSDEQLRSIPVVVVTAKSFGEDAVAREGGMISLARGKGFEAKEVIDCLQALLDAMEPQYAGDDSLPGHSVALPA